MKSPPGVHDGEVVHVDDQYVIFRRTRLGASRWRSIRWLAHMLGQAFWLEAVDAPLSASEAEAVRALRPRESMVSSARNIMRRRKRRLAVELLLIAVAYVGSYFVRFDLSPSAIPWDVALITLPLVMIIRGFLLILYGVHRSIWRHMGLHDLEQIIKASATGTIILAALVLFARSLELGPIAETPAGVLLLDGAATVFLAGGLRVGIRTYRRRFRKEITVVARAKRVMIVGAGEAGAALCHQMQDEPRHRLGPVVFVDDDPAKHGASIAGVPISGDCERIADLAIDYAIDLIIIAIPVATAAEMGRVVAECRRANIPFRTLPSLAELATGGVSVASVREVDVTDLLGRSVAEVDYRAIGNFLKDRPILVTGAGGSVGRELAMQIARHQPGLLLLIDRAENPLFYVTDDLKRQFPELDIVSRVVDVSDAGAVRSLLATYAPRIVAHAAAHKHVPLMEDVPAEAVRNNVGGTLTLIDAVRDANSVECFILVSTDKAVNPQSVMGATKRLAELLVSEASTQSETRFISVRFGNVLGSAGSVLPIFQKQIERGGPVEITHPDMERYFMALPEAAGLILQAGAIGSSGQLFVLDMGKPVRIVELAETLIELSGYRPYEQIEISFTGIRPGERITESLYDEGEHLAPTQHPKLRVVAGASATSSPVQAEVRALLAELPALSNDEVRRELWHLIGREHDHLEESTMVEVRAGS